MAAQARTMLFPLAALCLPALANIPRTPLLIAEKPHQGGASFAPALHRGPVAANPLIAPGMCECVCDFDRRSRNTGKERDAETGLDYFGARYYGGAQGRFISPDPPLTDQFVISPQSWNLYIYVRNNPLRAVDPTGHCSQAAGGGYTDGGKGLFPGKCSGGEIGKQIAGGNSATTYQNQFIANTAMSQVGSRAWLQSIQKDNFQCNSNKCNQGVSNWITMSGAPTPTIAKTKRLLGFDIQVGTRLPTAHEWADPNVDIPGWSKPISLALAAPGDVIAQGHGDFGHVGIVSDVQFGLTVSVNSGTDPAGIVTNNDWGFRTGPHDVRATGPNGEGRNDKPPVIRKYVGER